MLLKVAIKCYCVKNKGGIIYEKIVPRVACLLLALCLSLSAVGCQKVKIKEGQSISSEEEGMSINANGKMKLLSHQIIHWRQRKNMFMNI